MSEGINTADKYPSFVLQLISLAGLHSTATISNELSKGFKTDGMLAYVNIVQRRERELGCDVLTHQKWSGAGYIDGILGAIQSGSSGSKSMGEGNTEGSKLHSHSRSHWCGTDRSTAF